MGKDFTIDDVVQYIHLFTIGQAGIVTAAAFIAFCMSIRGPWWIKAYICAIICVVMLCLVIDNIFYPHQENSPIFIMLVIDTLYYVLDLFV